MMLVSLESGRLNWGMPLSLAMPELYFFLLIVRPVSSDTLPISSLKWTKLRMSEMKNTPRNSSPWGQLPMLPLSITGSGRLHDIDILGLPDRFQLPGIEAFWPVYSQHASS